MVRTKTTPRRCVKRDIPRTTWYAHITDKVAMLRVNDDDALRDELVQIYKGFFQRTSSVLEIEHYGETEMPTIPFYSKDRTQACRVRIYEVCLCGISCLEHTDLLVEQNGYYETTREKAEYSSLQLAFWSYCEMFGTDAIEEWMESRWNRENLSLFMKECKRIPLELELDIAIYL